MNLAKEISGEKLPREDLSSLGSDGRPELLTTDIKNMSDEEITEKIETILLERIKAGDNQALFQLGQLYFEQVRDILINKITFLFKKEFWIFVS